MLHRFSSTYLLAALKKYLKKEMIPITPILSRGTVCSHIVILIIMSLFTVRHWPGP